MKGLEILPKTFLSSLKILAPVEPFSANFQSMCVTPYYIIVLFFPTLGREGRGFHSYFTEGEITLGAWWSLRDKGIPIPCWDLA